MEAMNRRGVSQAAQLSAAHALLLAFTVLLVLKLDHVFSGAWWRVFSPLWLFHAVLARWRFSLPAPSDVHYCHRPPSHAFAATQLLVAFEVLLCIYLETSAVNLKIVFLPVVLLEIIIIVDNVRMCFSLMLEEMGDSSVNVTWEKTTHCLIVLSMAFILGATLFMVLILTGDTATGNWWGPYFVFSVGQCLAFLVCTKWTYPVVDRYSQTRVCNLSSGTTDYVNRTSCLVAKVEEDQKLGRMCSLQNIGGHFMKVLIIAFQVLLCMHLQGTPARAREIPFQIIFSPLLLLKGARALFSTLQLLERIGIMLLNIEAGNGRYFMFSSRVYDFLEFLLHGSRLLGWWSTDEGRGAEERLHHNHGSGCYTFSNNPPDVLEKMSKRDLVEEVWMLQVALNEQIQTTRSSKRKCYTFSNNPPDVLEKMSKRDLVEEVWTLQVALNEQIQTTRSSKRKYELLRNEKVLCKICSEMEIDVVLLPCGHWVLCRFCCKNRSACPACRAKILSGLLVYNA